MASSSTVDLKMSGLERALANLTKSSSTLEPRLSTDVIEGRVTFTLGLPSGASVGSE